MPSDERISGVEREQRRLLEDFVRWVWWRHERGLGNPFRESHPFWRLRGWLLVKLAGKRQVLINARIGSKGAVLHLEDHDLVVGGMIDGKELARVTRRWRDD